jgi:molecular chaperone Hsp33
MRAYAHFDPERVAAEPRGLLGRGHLAMTVDQGPDTERYQGIVPLDGGSLVDAAHVYFRQSEQIPSLLYLGAGELATEAGGKLRHTWRAGGIMIQHLPPEGGHGAAHDPDGWERAWHLMETVGYDELLDPMLAPERLLYRLFHEDGVRAGPARPLEHGCRCSRERLRGLIGRFPQDEIATMVEDGEVRVTCEFCGARYAFDPSEFTD